jgi:hypothetical protein
MHLTKTVIERAERSQQAEEVRNHPVNQIALKFLPEGWDRPDKLPVVSLMLWGLTEKPAELELQAGWPYPENLESQVLNLDRGSPYWAMSLLLGREDGEEGVLLVRQLRHALSPVGAASMLLQSLQVQMRAAIS